MSDNVVNNNFTEHQALLLKAVKVSGEIHLKYFQHTGLHVTTKDNRHRLLTQADTETQEAVRSMLLHEMINLGHQKAEIGFIGEEELYEPSKYTFIIDPIDGTTNFVYGIDRFCISIALYNDAQPLAGCIYSSTSDTAYIAEIGQGAIKIEKSTSTPLHIHETPLSDGLFAIPFTSVEEEMHRRVVILDRMQHIVQNIRVFGSTALDFCMLADNQLQFVANGAQSWDFAAADIIIRESGGATANWEGDPFVIDMNEYKKRHYLLACHPAHMQEFIGLIRSTKEK